MSTEMAHTDPKGIDVVRMSWNVWPRNKLEASKSVIPIAASIQPICHHPDIPTLPYTPPFQRNHFPHHYSVISETNVPAEIYPQYTLNLAAAAGSELVPLPTQQPVYLFVLNTCTIEEELGFAKDAFMSKVIELLPENALVGFISFGM